MNVSTMRSWAQHAVLPLAVLLFIDLFLDWHRASVAVGGALDIHAGSSAWNGWGALAGVSLLGLLVWEGFRFAGITTERVAAELVSTTLAVAALAFTAVEFFSGSASVDVAGVVNVASEGRLWPAYAGLALGALLALATLLRSPGPVATPRHLRLGTP
jgi:hypothetical protein